jgi:hypothetical protein
MEAGGATSSGATVMFFNPVATVLGTWLLMALGAYLATRRWG